VKSDKTLLKGVVDLDDYCEDELIVMFLRVPGDLVGHVDKAFEMFSTMIGSREEFILTALAYALCCIDEQERRSSKKKRSLKKRPSAAPES